jgi:hypothetical protein
MRRAAALLLLVAVLRGVEPQATTLAPATTAVGSAVERAAGAGAGADERAAGSAGSAGSAGAGVRARVALTPPLGYNSYDSYDWTMNETQLFASAAAMQQRRLLASGYDTITLDWYWYRDGRQLTRTLPKAGLPTNASCQIFFDAGGRMYPDPHRFPSTRECRCWTPITARLRALGLSLGLHLMPGAAKFAVDAGYRVPGTAIRLADVVDYTRQSHGGAICPGCTFYQLNMSKPGAKAWYDAYYAQLAGWGIKFIKADFLPAETDADNIRAMGAAITKSEAGMVLSIHGVSSPAEAKAIGSDVNMYRVTSDVHDSWGAVRSGFAASTEYAARGLIGAPGLNGRSWPNHDMLPLGLQKPPNGSPYPRPNGLSLDEQRTLMTLWSISRSPLIYGGRLDNMSQQTVELLTHPAVIALSQNATQPPTPIFPPKKLPPLREPHHPDQPPAAASSGGVGGGGGVRLGYQGLGYSLSSCNSSDVRQRWNASLLPAHVDDSGGSGSSVTAEGVDGEASVVGGGGVNLHKSYDKNGTVQQVCMRLMVYNNNCVSRNWTKMDLMDCSISHCGGASIRWILPAPPTAGGNLQQPTQAQRQMQGQGRIVSELTEHCLTSDATGHVAVAPCLPAAASYARADRTEPHADRPQPHPHEAKAPAAAAATAAGQEWRVAPATGPDAGADEISIVDVASGQCLTETLPIAPAEIATIWMSHVRVASDSESASGSGIGSDSGGGSERNMTYVALFNIEESAATVGVTMASLGFSSGQECHVREVWTGADVSQHGGRLESLVAAHGVALLELTACMPTGSAPHAPSVAREQT